MNRLLLASGIVFLSMGMTETVLGGLGQSTMARFGADVPFVLGRLALIAGSFFVAFSFPKKPNWIRSKESP